MVEWHLQRQVTTRSLWSIDAPRLSVPWTRTETAKRAFCVAALNVWNSIPTDIYNTSSLSTFRAKLTKKHFLLLLTRDDISTSAALYWLLVNIMALYKSFYITLITGVCVFSLTDTKVGGFLSVVKTLWQTLLYGRDDGDSSTRSRQMALPPCLPPLFTANFILMLDSLKLAVR